MAGTGETLCAACGLCCEGSLFRAGRLEEGETAPPGLRLSPSDPRTFLQPCSHLDRGCRIYDSRPRRCRAFRCGLLEDAEVGRLDLAAALGHVAAAKALAADLRVLLEAGEDSLDAAADAFVTAYESAPDQDAFRRANAEAVLKLDAFCGMTEQYFLRD